MQRNWTLFAILLTLLLTIFSGLSTAADVSLEKDMQRALVQSQATVVRLQVRLDAQQSVQADLTRLKALAADIRVSHLLLSERFRRRQERADALGPRAGERHGRMWADYQAAVDAYLAAMDGLQSPADVTPGVLENLKSLLDQVLPAKKRPIYGSLPYRHLNFAPRTPTYEPAITPAYRGGNKTVGPADTQSTPTAPISARIADLAQSLDWNPASIYEWVKNNIETQWYWGCMKGAEETLRQKSGNSADQASLLVALLRAAGYPARYVRGVIEFFPGIETARQLTGIDDVNQLAAFFQKAGIPYTPIVARGEIANFRIEHIWVETRVPYANYRGAIVDEHGQAWLGLDTSIKTAGFQSSQPATLLDEIDLSAMRDNYLTALQDDTLLETLQAQVGQYLAENDPQTTYDDLLRTRNPVAEQMKILPASLQFKLVAVTHEYGELPADLIHKVRFAALTSDDEELIDITLEAYKLSNRKITLTYEPDTVEDQEIINSYGGLSNTPSYLVRLRPALKVADERLAVGADGLPMGDTYKLSVELIAPGGSRRVENTHVIGNLAVMGVVCQDALVPEAVDSEETDAEQLLYEAVIDYIDQWNRAETELAALLQLGLARPLATLVTVGGVIEVSWLFDAPHGFEWQGLFVDADLRAVEVAGGFAFSDGRDPRRIFMQLAAAEGSALEGRILADHFQVESISTAKVLGIAADQGIPIVTIDSENLATLLPTLDVDDTIKEDITNAVNQNSEVRIPQSEIGYEDWTGVGYIKENPQTGEAGYMLSGMIAGGMTAWGLDKWPDYYAQRLINAFAEPPNFDPASAQYIQKITSSDLQKGAVGQVLGSALQVIVKDEENQPVSGAEVTFTVKAGGGKFENGQDTITVQTDFNGIAGATFTLGQKTADNPTFWWESDYIYSQQVGENIVDAALAAGTPIKTPFTAYGFPGEPVNLRKLTGDDKWGEVLTWLGFVKVVVEDSYGNPIANQSVTYTAGPAVERSSCSNPNQDSRPAQVIDRGDPCIENIPNYGQCATAATSREVVSDSKGASVYVMTGGTPDADYPITAAGGVLNAAFTLHTNAFGNCGGGSDPANRFTVSSLFAADSLGNNINAAKPGDAIPVYAKISFLREEETPVTTTLNCSEGPLECLRIIGSRQYLTDTDFTQAAVAFGGVDGTPQGSGLFLGNYEVKPGVNDITIDASATIGIRKSIISCSGCSIVDDTLTRSDLLSMRVYGVQIEVDTAGSEFPDTIIVPVDDNGFARCDTRISYNITPAEYKADTAYVIVYKDGQPINYIPTETQGQGFATISQGFQFDLASSYETEVVLNYGGDVEIRSDRKILGPGDVRVKSISIEDATIKVPIPAGETATARAETVPSGRTVVWRIVGKEDGVIAEINPSTGVIQADEITENGWIYIRATDSQIACVYKEAKVFIGCPKCEPDGTDCEDIEGGGFIDLSSVDFRLSLGKADFGQSAGELFLSADRPSLKLATPLGLTLSTLFTATEAIYEADDSLRQVLAPKTLADIIQITEFSYEIRFYRPEEITGNDDDLNLIDAAAEPFVIWRVENPDASTDSYNRLRITEFRDGESTASEYEWDEGLSTWTLSKADGLQVMTRAEEASGTDRIVTETIKDADGIIASVTQTTYREFAWGEEVIQTVQDPIGAALTTTTTYYEDPQESGSYGRMRSQVSPNGSWSRYSYDDLGRRTIEVISWLDAPEDAPAESSRAITYAFTPVDPNDVPTPETERLPRTVTETITGDLVAKTYYAYLSDPAGNRTEVVERCVNPGAAYGDVSNLRTETTFYPSSTEAVESGRIKSVRYPDDRLDTYIYESGIFSLVSDPGQSSFIPGTGDDLRQTVVYGTVAYPDGIAYKTTRETTIQDQFGNTLMQETFVYAGADYERIQWTAQSYDAFGRLVTVRNSNGTQSGSTWSCCRKLSDTDIQGITRNYSYDDLQRVVVETKAGIEAGAWPAQSDLQTSYTYDAAGRQLTQTIGSGGLSLLTSNVYDGAGRLRSATDASRLVTTYDYDPSGLVTRVTHPGGASEVTTRFLDGRIKSVTGADVIPRYYLYGVNADGTQWTKVSTGSPTSPRWEKTTVDMLGRTIRIEKPSFTGIEATESLYDSDGRLVKTITSGLADTLYEYDELGSQIRNGLDVDHSGALEIASNDRISETETLFAFINNNWWQESRQRVYSEENIGTATTTGISRTRLTGWSADKTEESVTADIHGNQTITELIVDRAGKGSTRIIDFPDSDIDVVSTSVNGLLMSSQSKTGVTNTFIYDALSRLIGTTDPRTGTAITHYNDKSQIDFVEDAAGNRTQFAYHPDSGLKINESNTLNKNTYFIYNDRGQVTHTWGDVPYPIKYEYDEYGQLSRMHTFRSGSNWNTAMWPEGDTGTADVTTWYYHESTGLLTAKEDAAGQSATYTYGVSGRLATRTWARTDAEGNPLITSYAYDPNTGELIGIDYSDTTQDIAFTYDRLGRQKTVIDAVGSRTFAYSDKLQLESETIAGLYDQVITRTYATSGVKGRYTGFNLGPNYSVTYGYDVAGRFNSVAWNIAGASNAATYSYVENSDLLQQLTTDNGLQTTYTYEPKRNLRTQVKNEFNTNLISQYDYQYDPIGRRTSVANSGQAFAATAFNRFEYDDRNQLTDSSRYLGADGNDLSNPVQPENRSYEYDPMGNRKNAAGWDSEVSATKFATYSTNSLNQYDQIATVNGQQTTDNLTYDYDGNLTAIASTDSTKLYK